MILMWLQYSPLVGLVLICGMLAGALWLILASMKADRNMQRMRQRAYLRELEERALRMGRGRED